MIKMPTFFIFLLLMLLPFQNHICHAEQLKITPFQTFNQSPMVQIYGLPAAENAIIQPPGHTLSLLSLDLASNSATNHTKRENILLDGESDRLTLALRYGMRDKLEIGADLPFIGYNGGIFDGFIERLHSFLGLPQGGRTQSPNNRLLFTYSKDGQEQLRLDNSNFGIGDIRISAGWQIYNDGSANPSAVALRTSLKLPTGDSARLHGSGSTDLALWLTGSSDYLFSNRWGHATIFGAVGAMAMTNSQVLTDQQQNFAAFGSLGCGWSPTDWLAFKAQYSAHSAFYKGSDLRELSEPALQLLMGGTLSFSPSTALDIAISEDANFKTSPDAALHLGLSHQF